MADEAVGDDVPDHWQAHLDVAADCGMQRTPQRITSLYGVVRGKPPAFFDGNAEAFTGLRFNLESEEFSFFQPLKMANDPSWIDVSKAFASSDMTLAIKAAGSDNDKVTKYVTLLAQLQNILDVDVHAEEVTGEDKTVKIVVDIFNRVNSGGRGCPA